MENWTSAFLIYASIYCEKHLDRAIALLKYMDIIRKAQMHFGGFAWLSYDKEFRARVSVNPDKPWGEVDQELWMQWMLSTQSSASTHTASRLPVTYRSFQPRPAHGGAGGTPVSSGGPGHRLNQEPTIPEHVGTTTRAIAPVIPVSLNMNAPSVGADMHLPNVSLWPPLLKMESHKMKRASWAEGRLHQLGLGRWNLGFHVTLTEKQP